MFAKKTAAVVKKLVVFVKKIAIFVKKVAVFAKNFVLKRPRVVAFVGVALLFWAVGFLCCPTVKVGVVSMPRVYQKALIFQNSSRKSSDSIFIFN